MCEEERERKKERKREREREREREKERVGGLRQSPTVTNVVGRLFSVKD